MADAEFTTERWLPVVGLEDRYEVSDLGRVRSLINCRQNTRKVPLVMRQDWDRCGYRRILLCGATRRKHHLVHRLVALAFLGVPDLDGAVCNHLDGVKTNNVLANLEWTTPKGNAAHAIATGLYPAGDRHGSRKHPEAKPRGAHHWTHRHPERVQRGESHPYALHPELHARGERCSKAKLTPALVSEIRARYAAGGTSHPALGREYGVAHSAIGRIVRRETWKHLD